jgi:hypothetical protein
LIFLVGIYLWISKRNTQGNSAWTTIFW